MKTIYRRTLTAALSISLLCAMEFGLMLLLSDHQPCFAHNTLWGAWLCWPLRIIAFVALYIFLKFLMMPAYKTVKDRMSPEQPTPPATQNVGANTTLALQP